MNIENGILVADVLRVFAPESELMNNNKLKNRMIGVATDTKKIIAKWQDEYFKIGGYNDSDARASVGASGSLQYDQSTGIFFYDDSELQESINSLSQSLSIETQNRISGDSNLQNQIDALYGAVIYIGHIDMSTNDIKNSPDAQDILTARAAELDFSILRHGFALIDDDNGEWWYNGEKQEWLFLGQFEIAKATNDTLGIVKGSTDNLMGSINADGEIGINGLQDALGGKINRDGDVVDGDYEWNGGSIFHGGIAAQAEAYFNDAMYYEGRSYYSPGPAVGAILYTHQDYNNEVRKVTPPHQENSVLTCDLHNMIRWRSLRSEDIPLLDMSKIVSGNLPWGRISGAPPIPTVPGWGDAGGALTSGAAGSGGSAQTMSRSDHTHTLPAYPTSLPPTQHGFLGGSHSGAADAAAARSTLGLGSAATQNSVNQSVALGTNTGTANSVAGASLPVSGRLNLSNIVQGNGVLGRNTANNGDAVYLAPAAANRILRSTAANAYEWGIMQAADVPNLDTGKLTTGLLPLSRGGTGVNNANTWVNIPLATAFPSTLANRNLTGEVRYNAWLGLVQINISITPTVVINSGDVVASINGIYAPRTNTMCLSNSWAVGSDSFILRPAGDNRLQQFHSPIPAGFQAFLTVMYAL